MVILRLTCSTPVLFVPADIQILMGSLVYLRHGIDNSPYRSLLETNQWAEICNIFTRDACALLGLSVESPLSVRLENHGQHTKHLLGVPFKILYIYIKVKTKVKTMYQYICFSVQDEV